MPFFVCGIELFIAVLDSFVIQLRTAVISVGNVRDYIISGNVSGKPIRLQVCYKRLILTAVAVTKMALLFKTINKNFCN